MNRRDYGDSSLILATIVVLSEKPVTTGSSPKITMEGEIWKQIENYPYLISNMGRVYGIERNRIERGEWTYNGYHRVVLSRSGETKKFRVSHLVAAAFCKGELVPRGICKV